MINRLYLVNGITLLYSIYVSGYKNKMGFFHFSTNNSYSNKKCKMSTPFFIDKGVSSDFLYWFSGFTDAEGNFLISLNHQYIRFRFKINLHIEDVNTLYTIKSNLKIGRVSLESNRNRCSFTVDNYAEIKNVICPIFKNFALHTSKKLDFENFYQAVFIKKYKENLSNLDKEKIIDLKNNMNSNRKIFTYNTTKSQIIINPNWFIGFLEGEGTFGIKTGSALYLQVAQKNTSQECLNAITTFLIRLSNNILQDNKILPVNVVSTINIKTNVVSLTVNSVDALYYYILPLLDSSNMYTRKVIDFKLWRIALLLKIQGYYYLPEGKNLFLDISDIINKRYSTNSTGVVYDVFERTKTIFKKDPPFDVKLKIPHVDNVRKFSITNRSEKPKIVYIYTNEGIVKGSPFASFSAAHKALGLNPSSNTCNRYIDTNRFYKNKYIFSSKPIDRTSRD